jgi:hypothetical protein
VRAADLKTIPLTPRQKAYGAIEGIASTFLTPKQIFAVLRALSEANIGLVHLPAKAGKARSRKGMQKPKEPTGAAGEARYWRD